MYSEELIGYITEEIYITEDMYLSLEKLYPFYLPPRPPLPPPSSFLAGSGLRQD